MPAMIQELVWALPPLGGARVLDLLGQYGAVQYSTVRYLLGQYTVQQLQCDLTTLLQLVAGPSLWRWSRPTPAAG